MTRLVVLVSVAAWQSVLWTSMARGDALVVPPRIPAYERFHATPEADPIAAGRLLVSELNCRSCHKADAASVGPVKDKQAPVLDQVGDRVRPEWIRAYLSSPHATKPGTTMPDLLGSLPDGERRQHVEALTHFLASTGSMQDSHPDSQAAQRGRGLFRRIGCLACHDDPEAEARLATSSPLPKLDDKYTAHSLEAFLKDPLKVRPSGRMPAIGLKDEEYRDIAQYFLRDLQLPPNVEFAAYQHRDWQKLPDFDSFKPFKTGKCAGFDLSVAGRTNNFAVRFSTNVHIAKAGTYQVILGSDDGSRLLIDGNVVADVDGVHPHQEQRKPVELSAGWHRVVVEYFQGGGEWTLGVEIEGNGLSRQPLANFASLSTDPPKPESQPELFTVDPALAAKGKELFASVGCASCHQLKVEGEALKSTKPAKPWNQLARSGGCLSAAPAAGLPHYGLSDAQVAAVSAFHSAPAAEWQPQDVVHHTLTTFNCYACHRRGEMGGVEEARNDVFTSSQQEMGDEGRLPPLLTGVGDKLQDDWLKHVLDQNVNDRQVYMHTRMPRFGGRNVGHLPQAFITVDRLPETIQRPEFDEPDYRVKAEGRHLVGGKALSCIKCHDFAQHPSQGVRAISLTTMTRRLREDWFYRYMANPTEYRPGTRMPAPWPFGQATVRDVLNGNVAQQMTAVWLYLSDGNKAAVPFGLVREPIELVADGAPVLYRNFIEGAGSRAIGVGYPEKLNLAWDANDMRLAMIWHGSFIDASRHWTGRGVGFEAPLGDHVLSLPAGPPLAQLASINDTWPSGLARENGFQFRGYTLDKQQRPRFNYSVGELNVEDSCEPVAVEGRRYPALRRTLTFAGPASDEVWYFRVVTAGSVAPIRTQGGWMVDENWTLIVDPSVVAEVRDSAGRKELLVPIRRNGTPLTIRLDYDW